MMIEYIVIVVCSGSVLEMRRAGLLFFILRFWRSSLSGSGDSVSIYALAFLICILNEEIRLA